MPAPGFRAALYWTPLPDDPLAQAGNTWLGRDAEANRACAQPAIAGIAEFTAAPRQYGFHATLRPPMRLGTGWAEFCSAAEDIARDTEPFDMPPLEVAEMSGFLALREMVPSPAMRSLADACVRLTNPHRLPPGDAELAQRRAQKLSARQENMLRLWGYPYVMEEWRFHMTLTRRLAPHEMAMLRPKAEAHFATALRESRRVSEVAIFTQDTASAFLVAERLRLEGKKAVLF